MLRCRNHDGNFLNKLQPFSSFDLLQLGQVFDLVVQPPTISQRINRELEYQTAVGHIPRDTQLFI